MLDFIPQLCHNRCINKSVGIQKNEACRKTQKGQIMSNAIAPQVGSPFTTAKSKVSGIVQEVVANKNGTFRVRLDVAGQPRWTTVK